MQALVTNYYETAAIILRSCPGINWNSSIPKSIMPVA